MEDRMESVITQATGSATATFTNHNHKISPGEATTRQKPLSIAFNIF
jgi:hypothetical protein